MLIGLIKRIMKRLIILHLNILIIGNDNLFNLLYIIKTNLLS
jgi:hypothetical protein